MGTNVFMGFEAREKQYFDPSAKQKRVLGSRVVVCISELILKPTADAGARRRSG